MHDKDMEDNMANEGGFAHKDMPAKSFSEYHYTPLTRGQALVQVRAILGSHGFVRVSVVGEKQAGTFEHGGFDCRATGETWEEVLSILRHPPVGVTT